MIYHFLLGYNSVPLSSSTMAEFLATMVVGPLVSMVMEKASSYLLDQYNVMEGMEELHEVLRRRLLAILDVIADAETQAEEHGEGAKAWLEAVRDVAYQANDVFDEFKYEALRRKAKEGRYRNLGKHVVRKLFPTHHQIMFRYRMGNKLKMILQAIDVLTAEMDVFRFELRSKPQLSLKWRQTDSKIDDSVEEIVSRSRAQDKQKVIDILLGQGNRMDLTVLPIVGMGGLGKTTLAQLIYNDSKIQEHFQLLLWVCVSDNFDVDFLAKSIVKAATAKECLSGEKPPLDCLREVVSGKRYLLVLDDVWNRDASQWEKLKSCLQHGGMGSSVLITTHDEAVARLMGTTETYKLGLLSKSFVEEIIRTKASSMPKDVVTTNELDKMVGDMANKCGGCPLAASALGFLLHTKSSMEEWKAVSSRTTICDRETGILQILKLSYNDLPSQMRQCFSFCAMFLKGYEIDMETLIQLWMANGFISEENGVCAEIRGKQIFNELASRSFFHDVKEAPFDSHPEVTSEYMTKMTAPSKHGYCSRITCKIYDLMHEVAQSALGKECAAMEPSKIEDFTYPTRHLFVSPKVSLNGFPEEISPTLQTFLCANYTGEEMWHLSKDNSIRALRISGYPSLKPKYLHHLRYLDLSRSYIKALPEDISALYHLQTLNLSGCSNLVQLPKEMKYMTSLRHLYTHGCPKLNMMPPELGCLTSLRTLTCFVAGSGWSCSNVAELGMLDIGGHLEVRQLENVTKTDAQAANLENKKELIELRLEWIDPCREPQHHHKVLEGFKPHDGIKALKIYGYGGSTLPVWINSLNHMVELVFSDCKDLVKLPPLWRLPELRMLCMRGLKNLQCLFVGDPPFTFKKLKELSLYEMPNLKTWWDTNEVQGQGLMLHEMEKLSIHDCKQLTALPRASAIKELKDLSIMKCPELTTLPEAPKLNALTIGADNQQIFLHAARDITLLSKFMLRRKSTLPTEHSLIKLVDDSEKWSQQEPSLRDLSSLYG